MDGICEKLSEKRFQPKTNVRPSICKRRESVMSSFVPSSSIEKRKAGILDKTILNFVSIDTTPSPLFHIWMYNIKISGTFRPCTNRKISSYRVTVPTNDPLSMVYGMCHHDRQIFGTFIFQLTEYVSYVPRYWEVDSWDERSMTLRFRPRDIPIILHQPLTFIADLTIC